MHRYIHRQITGLIERKLRQNPVVAIVGPRQCGKSTLARAIISQRKNVVFLDLERPSDLGRLREAELFFGENKKRLICLDEIQRLPDIFPVIRSVVDENNRPGQFLVLGSASPDLLRQAAESLAGRVSYVELTPFLYKEVVGKKGMGRDMSRLWLRGSFPRSLLAGSNAASYEWRLDFIRTFLERDIPNLGLKVPAAKLYRFWRMFAHVSGQVLNSAKLASSLGVSVNTVRHYIDILEQTYMYRVLMPYAGNIKKRLVKSPKIYIRDTGLLHSLLDIETMNDLFAHPVYGASWESFVVQQITGAVPHMRHYFYRNSNGNEIDLILEYKNSRIAVECKASASPTVNKGFMLALKELAINDAWIIAPVKEKYPYAKHITVAPPEEFLDYISV